MRRLRYTEAALDNISDIADYIAHSSGSATIARDFTLKIRRRCVDLASLPGTLGRDRSELRSDLRSLAFKSYVIFFRYTGEALEIVAILEGHRDTVAYFRDDEV
jgi:plasmid stabilization system protein ParE